MRRWLLTLTCAALAAQAHAEDWPEGDAQAGRKAAGMCRTCHGLDGVASIPIAPNLAGEGADYLADQLAAFRSGARQHEMMSVVAASLSDQSIADLAAWYSGIEISADASPVPEAAISCTACHGEDGLAVVDNAPNLAGETNIYIETQLKAFQNGRRENEIMTPIAMELEPAQMREIADWFASIEIKVELPAQ